MSTYFFFLMIRRPPRSTLFPYTTPLPILIALIERLLATGHAHDWMTFERSEEHTSELQSRLHLVCRLLLEKKKIYSCRAYSHPPTPAPSAIRAPVVTS